MNVSLNVHQIIKMANTVAAGAAHPVPTMPIHLLYGTVMVGSCLASKYLKEVDITADTISKVKMVHRPDMTVSAILHEAEYISGELGEDAVVSEALLFVLCTESLQTVEVIEAFGEGTCRRLADKILTEAGIDPEKFSPIKKKQASVFDQDELLNQLFGQANSDDEEDGFKPVFQSFFGYETPSKHMKNTQNSPQNGTNSGQKSPIPRELLQMGCDLTARASEGKIDNIIGRDEETSRCIEILCRKTKNNPVLIGEAGVGKSAIVEGLALKIVKNEVPELLKNKTIFSLDIGSLMAGTKYRGELEQRLDNLIKTLKKREDVILFIDEIHQIATAASKENEVGIGEMLKPVLARGEMQTIGATTTEEYRKFIERDAALERRFQPIIVNPPSTEQSIEILRGIKANYEKFHGLTIGDEAIVAAVTLSDRYITDRNLPDKAIDLLDEACAKVRVNKKSGDVSVFITAEDIANVVSRATGVPVSKMTGDERANLANLETEMKKYIIGQDAAVTAIAKSIRRSRAGVGDANRPVGSFMFLGRTGVGKTEVCKVLAKQLFMSDKSLIKLDMSEYTESHSVSKLIGAPAGYVGYDDGAVVCERVRRNPYCIVLFDEIEKAHPDVYNVMLQILDEGRLTDNKGKTTSFRNAIIVMTSNTGVENLTKTAQIGFGSDNISSKEEDLIMQGLKKRFRPEFINRIDNIVVFNSLEHADVMKIAALQIDNLKRKLDGIGLDLVVDKDIIKWLVDKGYNREFGARPIKRIVQTEIEDPIAELILQNEKPKKVTVKLVDNKPSFALQ